MKPVLILFSFLFVFNHTMNAQTEKDKINQSISTSFSQSTPSISAQNYEPYFQQAYQLFPTVPKGILEAVATANTGIFHVPASAERSCAGIPQAFGLFGLIENGKGYFRNNLLTIADISRYNIAELKASPEKQILAYAEVFSHSLAQQNSSSKLVNWQNSLMNLSELPRNSLAQDYAASSFLYTVFTFLENPVAQKKHQFPSHQLNLAQHFGSNYKILSASNIRIDGNAIFDEEGNNFQKISAACDDVADALWVPADVSNYSSRAGTAISAVTVHKMQGSYAGAISWFQNPSSNVSAHYMVRNSDGQITQMVCEINKAWHVGAENPYTIGIENDGYVENDNNSEALYLANAIIVKTVAPNYGINTLRLNTNPCLGGAATCQLGGCIKIKGHQNFQNQSHTDPGIYWDWDYLFKIVNDSDPQTTLVASSGTLSDSGGPTGNYANDERNLYLIAPTSASTVSLDFVNFDLEADWDYLRIYDGDNEFAPLIGKYTGSNLPTSITSSGGAVLLDFRSDCATTNAGFTINWTATTIDLTPPSTSVSFQDNWQTTDFAATFSATDNAGGSGIGQQFYQVIQYDGSYWRANGNQGYLKDNFATTLHTDWDNYAGTWTNIAGKLTQSDEASNNTILSAAVNQNNAAAFLYDWSASISGTGTNKRAGLHFMCDNAAAANRGNSYFVYFRENSDKLQIYSVTNDVFTLESDLPFVIDAGVTYNFKVIYTKSTGTISVYVNGAKASEWTDPTPLQSGDFVSFRTGNCSYEVDQVNVYKLRSSDLVTIGVGQANTKDIQYQNAAINSAAGKIKSIVIDNNNNISAIGELLVNVDWTAPNTPSLVNDGLGADEQSSNSINSLSANWTTSTDPHSAITNYWYSIGTSAGANDVLGLTNNGAATSFTQNGMTLIEGQIYYINIVAENGAGLQSPIQSSNGITLVRDVIINAKVFLSGPYLASSGLMNDALRPLLGIDHPYNVAPWYYAGTESTTPSVLAVTGNFAVVDFVLVELRDRTNSASILGTRVGLLLRDGAIVDMDGVSPLTFSGLAAADYYVAIHHRNHHAAMTASSLPLGSTASPVDFTSVATYGIDAQNLINGVPALWSGETNQDGVIDAGDRSASWNLRNQSGYLNADCNMDGVVDAGDRSLIWNHRNIGEKLP